jgi:hypothetical protein
MSMVSSTKNAITIGGTLSALQWAYQQSTKLIINNFLFPRSFEPSYVKNAWGLLYYKLIMDGKIIGGDSTKALKINESEIVVVDESNVINRLPYGQIYVFDEKNIIGLPDIKKEVEQCYVIDKMFSNSFVFKDRDFYFKTNDPLVTEIYVKKEHSNSPIEVWAISNLSQAQLQDFEYSDTMAKFKVEAILKEHGYTGNSMKRSEILLEVESREIQKKMNLYEQAEKIKFIYE